MIRERAYVGGRLGALALLAVLVAGAAAVVSRLERSGPGGAHSTGAEHTARVPDEGSTNGSTPIPPRSLPVHPVAPLQVSPPAHASASWTTVARVHGRPVAWLTERSGVTLMRFEQGPLRLDLHAGSSDGGVAGWRYGDQITPSEIHHVVAAFNGGFKLSYHDVGFMSGGHVAVPLRSGLASIVTYTDGSTDIGAWHEGVPSAHARVFSVLQNQQLLVDNGAVAATAAGCVIACWGGTVAGRDSVPRSGLGVTAGGQLVWAAGEDLLPAELGAALVLAGAVRAIELDINPYWVAGYLYIHHQSGPSAVPVVPGQRGIAGELLEPYTRDFLTIVAN
ncbi:MAG TPA: hypothetical protein VGX72_05300 [Solirubrobacteraceae bacterium]|jgi:hypothetical protein|nr:hypothetical protein [Solirubrobacteraceae bacterium]